MKQIFITLTFILFSISIFAQFENETKLIANDASNNDMLGYDADISGNYAIVGAMTENSLQGSAYIFKLNGTSWEQQAKITASAGNSSGYYGITVTIDGDYAAVGSYGDNYAGAVYIYKRDGENWIEQAHITDPDGASSDRFGYSIDICGDYLAIGTHAKYPETAFVYKRNEENWDLLKSITASDSNGGHSFGLSIAISEQYLAVGACEKNNNGAVYVYENNSDSWNNEKIIECPVSSTGGLFGFSVAVDTQSIIAGAPEENFNGNNSGTAYIFENIDSEWIEQIKLTTDADANDMFGWSVDIDDGFAVVSALHDIQNVLNSGSGFVYQNTTAKGWEFIQKLNASDGPAENGFGRSIAISGQTVIVGADKYSNNKGAAYIYDDNNVNINSQLTSEQLHIYPNPSNGRFTITNYESQITNIQIIDITGKIIHKSEFVISNQQFSIPKKGIYIIKIKTENKILTQKLIIN